MVLQNYLSIFYSCVYGDFWSASYKLQNITISNNLTKTTFSYDQCRIFYVKHDNKESDINAIYERTFLSLLHIFLKFSENGNLDYDILQHGW